MIRVRIEKQVSEERKKWKLIFETSIYLEKWQILFSQKLCVWAIWGNFFWRYTQMKRRGDIFKLFGISFVKIGLWDTKNLKKKKNFWNIYLGQTMVHPKDWKSRVRQNVQNLDLKNKFLKYERKGKANIWNLDLGQKIRSSFF